MIYGVSCFSNAIFGSFAFYGDEHKFLYSDFRSVSNIIKTSAVPNYERKRKCSDGQDRICKNVEDTDRNQLNRNATCASNKETAVNRFRGCRSDGWGNFIGTLLAVFRLRLKSNQAHLAFAEFSLCYRE